MQLIEYSAQSNDLAAPLKCRKHHIQRENQHQRSFQLTLKTKVLAPLITLSTCYVQGIKTQCAESQLIEYSTKTNDLTAPLKCRQLRVHREHQRQCSFQLPLKTKVLARFTTRNTCQLQGIKTQCAEMQLIVYSTQSNDLAAPLKCRKHHIQRENQHQRSFQLTLKPRFWHHLQQEVHVSSREEKHNALKCSLLSIPHKVMIQLLL